MNRAELVKAVAILSPKLSRDVVDKIVGDTLTTIAQEVAEGSGTVRLYSFGTFSRKTTKPRTSANPKTGETVHVPAKQTIKLVVSKDLVKLL
jgi:nucleoid DNA-binding protein